ncbi:MAG: alpha/beta hydrolase [Actinomycetes bacterium]
MRFDNRDVGESTHLADAPTPDPSMLLFGRKSIPYRLTDMADDTIGLIEALGFDQVDLFGVSLGGFISQTVAIRAPERVRTLTLMMTSTGSPLVGHPKPKLIANVFRRSPKPDRKTAIDSAVEALRAISSPGYPFEADFIRDIAARSYDRSYDPAGYMRQFAAVRFQPNRTTALAQLSMPTLVMHGLADPLISVSGGVAIARAIPGARFVGFHGMGHDLPRELWPDYAAAVDALTTVASRSRTD